MNYEVLNILKKENLITIDDVENLYKHFGISTIYHNNKIDFVWCEDGSSK